LQLENRQRETADMAVSSTAPASSVAKSSSSFKTSHDFMDNEFYPTQTLGDGNSTELRTGGLSPQLIRSDDDIVVTGPFSANDTVWQATLGLFRLEESGSHSPNGNFCHTGLARP
jgi:hypothetical protein